MKSNEIKGRGGAGRGQGRKPSVDRVFKQAIAQAFFKIYGGEAEAWAALAKELKGKDSVTLDLRLLFDAMRYWSDQLHGKASQPFRHSGPEDGDPIKQLIIRDIGS